MFFTIRLICALATLLALAIPAQAETSQLVCRGQTYSVTSGERTAIKRFSRRDMTLTADQGRTSITYAGELAMEVDITDSHYRATRSRRTGDWLLILLDKETFDVTVSEFNTLPGQKHRSERFVGSCEVSDPIALAS